MLSERTQCGKGRKIGYRHPVQFCCERDPGHKTASRALNISFDTGDLSGKEQPFPSHYFKMFVQESRALQECIPMHYTISRKFSMFESRNKAEDPFLLSKSKARLKTDKIIKSICGIVLSKLNDRKRFFPCPGIDKSYRFHRPEGRNHKSSSCHTFDWHTAFENHVLLKSVDRCGFGVQKFANEHAVFFFIHRRVQIIAASVISAQSEESVIIK